MQKNVTDGARVTPARRPLRARRPLPPLGARRRLRERPRLRPRGQRGRGARDLPARARSWRGRVTYVAPTVDEKTRTVKVRLEVDNTGDDLKPEMFTDVELLGDRGRARSWSPRTPSSTPGTATSSSSTAARAGTSRARSSSGPAPGGFRGPLRPRRGRPGRGLRELPAGLGIEPPGRPRGSRPVIARIIRFSAENRVLVLLLTAIAVAYGVWTLRHIPVDAIPDLSDTQVVVYSRWDRSPDVIEDQVTYPDRHRAPGHAQREGRPRLLGLRVLLRLRDLQGRDGPLLGAQPGARVPEQDPAPPARGRAHRDRPRRHRRGLGLPVRPRGRLGDARRSATCARSRTGRSATGCSRCPGWRRSPPSAASSSSTR